MNAKDAIRQTYDMNERIMHAYLNDLDDVDLLIRPVEGMNHIAWQLGHLISSERHLIEKVRPGSSPPLPEGFVETHGREATTSDDPGKFRTKDEYLRLWQEQREATKALLDNMNDSELDASGPDLGWMKRADGRVGVRLGGHPRADARRPVGRRASEAQQADRDLMAAVPGPILEALAAVAPPDLDWSARAAVRQDRLTMPPGSLGRLLEIGRQLAAIQRTDRPEGHPALVAVFAADHGVAAAGVSAYPREVTGQMVANYLRGGAAINVLARRVGAAVRVADLGVACWPEGWARDGSLHAHPIRPGTSNFLDGPAMARDEAFRAVQVGLDLADRWTRREGFRIVALGEMGISNTTTAAALLAALTGAAADRVVGRGTGVDDQGYHRKCRAVAAAVARHGVGIEDTWDWLARVGGFEILGLAGLAIGAARNRALVVIDGLISGAAGLVAAGSAPTSKARSSPPTSAPSQAIGLRSTRWASSRFWTSASASARGPARPLRYP